MNKTRMTYFREEDVLHIIISGEKEANSIELSPNITAEMNEKGELIGIEIRRVAGSIVNDQEKSSLPACGRQAMSEWFEP